VPIVDGFRLMCGGTLAAAALAVERGASAPVVHLGGGFHHAFPAHGEGFCLFNDVAVAIRLLQDRGAIARAAVVDLDVHHGNGTAFIFEDDPAVFTCSIHQQHNYPAFKPRGSLDIGLPDAATGEQYLAALDGALTAVAQFAPDLVIYLAGADPYEHDRLGGLGLTKDALRVRDRMVFDRLLAAGIPITVVLAGGYAYDTGDTVDIHVATIEESLAVGFDDVLQRR
jgi:acetoin utilization deacetylase AcuC-like enzyme